jgi:hypothetical protein
MVIPNLRGTLCGGALGWCRMLANLEATAY